MVDNAESCKIDHEFNKTKDMIDEKFKLSDDTVKSHFFSNCKVHPDIVADYKCPICKNQYCYDCITVLKRNKSGIGQKFVCNSCSRIFNIKFYSFYFVLIFLIFYLIEYNYKIFP